MKYKKVINGVFIERPNRFIAVVDINGKTETVHVKNTGRCKELLVPGCTVYLADEKSKTRKTRYDLICAEKKSGDKSFLINLDSQAPNAAAEEWLRKGGLFSKNAVIKREVTYKESRFDFYIEDEEKKIFLEVKGVTLENDGVVSFPDAPTERGIKHINELIDSVKNGYEAYILFVVQMKSPDYFTASDINHPEFGKALRRAKKSGVHIIAVDCLVKPDELTIEDPVKVKL